MLNNLTAQSLPEIVTLRQKLHQIPELKFEEFKTSALIAQQLQTYGCTNITSIANTGVTAIIDSGRLG
jgi:metal-dependent amidase/aminoacylase/carboxypeptidase family protein